MLSGAEGKGACDHFAAPWASVAVALVVVVVMGGWRGADGPGLQVVRCAVVAAKFRCQPVGGSMDVCTLGRLRQRQRAAMRCKWCHGAHLQGPVACCTGGYGEEDMTCQSIPEAGSAPVQVHSYSSLEAILSGKEVAGQREKRCRKV